MEINKLNTVCVPQKGYTNIDRKMYTEKQGAFTDQAISARESMMKQYFTVPVKKINEAYEKQYAESLGYDVRG